MGKTSRAGEGAGAVPQEARTLGFLLREAYASMQEGVYAAVAASGHAGVRPAHSAILRHLPAQGGRVADIARAAGMAKQSVSYVVDDLVDLGYLRIQPDPDDRRAKQVSYTARGRKLVADLMDASRECEAALGLALGAARLRELRRILELVPTVELRGSRTIP